MYSLEVELLIMVPIFGYILFLFIRVQLRHRRHMRAINEWGEISDELRVAKTLEDRARARARFSHKLDIPMHSRTDDEDQIERRAEFLKKARTYEPTRVEEPKGFWQYVLES